MCSPLTHMLLARTRLQVGHWAAIALFLLSASSSEAITLSPFGSTGEGGSANGQTLLLGSGGAVFELDAFLAVGSSGGLQLSVDALPESVAVVFASDLSADSTDLTLTYRIENLGSGSLESVRFLSFLDAEIDESLNGFFNESATTIGELASGQGFEIDDPFRGDLFANLLAGTLDNTNAFQTSDGDVAMALSFDLGSIGPSESAEVRILLSEDGGRAGKFAIEHFDADPQTETRITFSGVSTTASPIPEPNAIALFLVGLVVVRTASRRRRRRVPCAESTFVA